MGIAIRNHKIGLFLFILCIVAGSLSAQKKYELFYLDLSGEYNPNLIDAVVAEIYDSEHDAQLYISLDGKHLSLSSKDTARSDMKRLLEDLYVGKPFRQYDLENFSKLYQKLGPLNVAEVHFVTNDANLFSDYFINKLVEYFLIINQNRLLDYDEPELYTKVSIHYGLSLESFEETTDSNAKNWRFPCEKIKTDYPKLNFICYE